MIIREKKTIKSSNARTKINYQVTELELERLREKRDRIQNEIDILERKQCNRRKAMEDKTL